CAGADGRILSIHSRRASKDVLDCLEECPEAGVPVLHWFSGSPRDLDRAVRLGCWFSVGPVMLKSERGRSLVARMPRNRILTESDGPFAQIGGAAVMPWEVNLAVGILSAIWGEPNVVVDEVLSRNLGVLTQQAE